MKFLVTLNEHKMLLAPNGQRSNLTPEQYKFVRTPEFKEWFGDWESNPKNSSKVIDENGEPLVCYHGTENNFNIFKDNHKIGWLGKGIYFTPNKKIAKGYGKIVLRSFLNIRKPFKVIGEDPNSVITEVKKKYNSPNEDFGSDVSITLKEKKHDGVFFKHWDQGNMFSCFYPNQIKLL